MHSEFSVTASQIFIKSLKGLVKKYPSIRQDLENLKESLLINPTQGTPLGKNCYKVRFKISSKRKGKSGGARILTLVLNIQTRIILLDIYDKSDQSTVSDKDLEMLIKLSDL